MSKAKQPVPAGFSTVTPHLVLPDTAAAIEFYKKAFGAVELMRLAMPDGKIMHACIQIGDSRVMMVDEFEGCGTKSAASLGTANATMHLFVEDVDAVFKQAVDAGATAMMQPQEMFWGDRYSVVVDPFGQPWSIATHLHDLTKDEIMQRMAEMPCTPPAAEKTKAAAK